MTYLFVLEVSITPLGGVFVKDGFDFADGGELFLGKGIGL